MKRRTQIYLTNEQHAVLTRVAELTERTTSAVIRLLLDRGLDPDACSADLRDAIVKAREDVRKERDAVDTGV